MHLGALARRSALTVRTLHHFDQIDLLRPSTRSEGGYRLYNGDDVARLHGIQALHHWGIPFKQIGVTLAGGGEALPVIVARQTRALDHEISQATALRGRLALLMHKFAGGAQPAMDEWLDALALLAIYARYFPLLQQRRDPHHRGQLANRARRVGAADGAGAHHDGQRGARIRP